MSQTHTYFVNQMHCKACEILLESELAKNPEVISIKANLADKIVTVTTENELDSQTLAKDLNKLISNHNYTLTSTKITQKINWNELGLAFTIALFIGLAFLALQKLGLANWINGDKVSYPLAFGIGVIASLSSCMAVVGGLLLSLSATWAKQIETENCCQKDVAKTPHIFFHLGRLIGFFVLGGLLGLLGTAFSINQTVSTGLNILVALVMFILGLNLLELFDWTKRLQFNLPKSLTKNLFQNKKINQFTPILLGISTFFLPCGFTQSMELYSLSTGSFLSGALTMLAFALGTLPVLAIISFSSFNFSQSKYAGLFFKTAGCLVILFALFNLYSAMVALGLVPPILNI